LSTIHISGIKFYAHHGCLEEETAIGGDYIVDISIQTDFRKAAAKDDLSKTVDYVTVCEIVREEMAVRSKLIEHVAARIGDALIRKLPRVEEAEVKVTKLNPPVHAHIDSVSVVITAKRKKIGKKKR